MNIIYIEQNGLSGSVAEARTVRKKVRIGQGIALHVWHVALDNYTLPQISLKIAPDLRNHD